MMENNGMSDIVERLENMWMEQEPKLLWTDMEAITDEAAEEITRLRAEHKMAFEAVGDVVKANDDLRAENEKLREALKPFANYYTLPTFEEIKAAAAALKETGDE